MFYSWLSPKLGVRPLPHKGGCGIVAAAPLAKGELLVVWGGRVIPAAELDPTLPDFTRRVLQIEEDLFLFNPLPDDPADCFNHSCEPNAGFCGQVALVALRDIPAGEEVTFDYAMCDGSPYDEFECHCGSPRCRGRVSGEDWKIPALQQRYAGYFSPYLQRRIANQG